MGGTIGPRFVAGRVARPLAFLPRDRNPVESRTFPASKVLVSDFHRPDGCHLRRGKYPRFPGWTPPYGPFPCASPPASRCRRCCPARGREARVGLDAPATGGFQGPRSGNPRVPMHGGAGWRWCVGPNWGGAGTWKGAGLTGPARQSTRTWGAAPTTHVVPSGQQRAARHQKSATWRGARSPSPLPYRGDLSFIRAAGGPDCGRRTKRSSEGGDDGDAPPTRPGYQDGQGVGCCGCVPGGERPAITLLRQRQWSVVAVRRTLPSARAAGAARLS